MGHWLSHFFGLDNLSGAHYGFWSGAGSDISELAIVGAVLVGLRRINCHHARCPRIGRLHDFTDPDSGVVYRLCRHHHPAHPKRKITAAHLAHWRDQHGRLVDLVSKVADGRLAHPGDKS